MPITNKSKDLSELLKFFEARYFDGGHVQKDRQFCPLSILCPANTFVQLVFSTFLRITCYIRILTYICYGEALCNKPLSVFLSKKAILSMNIITGLLIQHFIILP